ncbi:Sec34-domain-containing protein [Gloeophyllum trabeum ATCC 11539]|uniref:Conserved oligomeric Golgi complex subunit 3 n=1 Tax=Gloeophyllum trabeum (strain ATCC 11539 / FP-39264 / Madison 617) TaxID=670483 RepID=S7RQJ1_GLOTA|nr:Sec34-domain-containing protein [Gloeophyllum trabeum ATCC 11539]EPQ56850.1 Sec34-domain-containing protein [Gloeophyllum trabeum ATCC 11539]
MTSRPSAIRRTATPTVNAPSPHPKPTITLEEWEAKAPLGELELKSVNAVKAACERVPLPLKFSIDDAPSRPSTPTSALRNLKPRAASSSRPPTPRPAHAATSSLLPHAPITTPQQFYDWFALVDRSVAHAQEAHFRAHLAQLGEHLQTCDRLLARVGEVEDEVEGMLGEWRSVEEGGRSLKEACERLLEDRDRLIEVTEAIGERLEYFQELEHATRMLNHPGESLVLQTDFLYMVERVDICIEYLRQHRHFKEAEIYLLRFQQCLTRAMTLIRMYFVGSLKALTADITKRISSQDVSTTAQTHLLYTRFRSLSPHLRPLLGELERRARAHPAELSALLGECHQAYFGARRGLLVPRMVEEMKGLDPGRTELVELTRAGCSYLKQLCIDEFELFRAFFNSGEDQLYAYLENLCDYLYDDLRPRILHEPRLTVLCEVCTVLQALMVLDVPSLPSSPSSLSHPDSPSSAYNSDSDSDDNEEGQLTFGTPGERRRRKGLGRLHIAYLLQMVLQDAQTRLFFKAQSVIQSEVRYYVPKPEDLAWPDRLLGPRNGAGSGNEITVREKESVSELFSQVAGVQRRETWYPTVQKTAWVLSQLHNFVKPAIFEDIAQEAIGLCRQSLVSASELIKARNNAPPGPLDAQLFLVRHLLILKEMTVSLDLRGKDLGVGGSSGGGGDYIGDAFASVVNRTSSLLPASLFASLGLPQADQGMTDARQGIDADLKKACEEVISLLSDPIAASFQRFVAQVRAYSAARKVQSNAPPSPSATIPTEQAAAEIQREFHLACHRDFRAGVARMRLYLEDDKTVEVLVGHATDRIVDAYAEFRDMVWGLYAGALRGEVMGAESVREMLREIASGGEQK